MLFLKRWRNWDGRIRCRPQRYAEPRSEQELAATVARWSAQGRQIRIAGSGHSFTPLVQTEDSLIWPGRLRGLCQVDGNSASVFAGTTLHELGRLLARQGLAQENLGDIDAQSLAGALSTGTHGTGAELPSLAGQAEALTLVTADGEIRTIDTTTPDLLDAARVSLGTLGVITRVRLRLQPAYRLHLQVRPGSLAECLEHAHRWADQHRHFEFFWFPHTGRALLKFTDRTEEPPSRGRLRHKLYTELTENTVFRLACEYLRLCPRHAAAVSRLLAGGLGTGEVIDASHRVFATPRRVRFHEMEYNLPREALVPAMHEIRRWLERHGQEIHFPIECRFSAAESAWLSPACQRDSVWLAVHTYRGRPFEKYFLAMEQIFLRYGGRPHWGKWHSLDAGTLARLYPRREDFLRIRRQFDPRQTFLNPPLRHWLGITGS